MFAMEGEAFTEFHDLFDEECSDSKLLAIFGTIPNPPGLPFAFASKKAQSLLDAADRPLNDAILSGALHGLARDSYEERFSLDDRGLREGGARIAGAQGDLGQLLHAGLSGLTGMGRALDALEARADTFHKKRGRSTALKAGTDRLREIGRTLRGLPIYSPDRLPELLDADNETVVLAAVSSRGARALIRQRLATLGLGEGEQFWCVA